MAARTIFALSNPIQPYAWGSRTAIAEFLGVAASETPQAELWMGAHERAPSRLVDESGEWRLDAWIARDPRAALGAQWAARGSTLPFLFKILAVEHPLSLQTHPDANRARAGFERENRAGIPLGAAERCYADPNPKPELICALTRFRALCRFREAAAIRATFSELGAEALSQHSVPGDFLGALLSLAPAERAALLDRAIRWARGSGLHHDGSSVLLALCEAYPGDVGALAPLFLNVVELAPGEALYLPPGELHAYLSGTGLELMANSDNVLRGGLTAKHVNKEELLAALGDTAGPVEPLLPQARSEAEAVYPTPVREFELAVLDTRALGSFRSRFEHGAEILLCTEGSCELRSEGAAPLPLSRGASLFVAASAPAYELRGAAVVYRASPTNS